MKAHLGCLLFLFTVEVYIEFVLGGQKCKIIYAKRHHRLVNHTIKTIKHISPLTSCIDYCQNESGCYSFNYFMTSLDCELNNATKRFHDGDLVYEENSFYMDMLQKDYNPCTVFKPCLNDGSCTVHWNNDSYSCQCPRSHTGRHCETLKTTEDLQCQNKTMNLCTNHIPSWAATILSPTSLSLANCNQSQVDSTNQLLVFVSKGDITDYGKYEIVSIEEINGCNVTLQTQMKMMISGSPCEIIAQRFPDFTNIALTQSCTLTCNPRSGGLGGVMAFRAEELVIDSTSKIDMNYKGFFGGVGGSLAGGGGYGGETFACLAATYGKGGNTLHNGVDGGGGGDGAAGGPGGLNAGGGGGDSKLNSDDGGGGGGGGGHFSGGGGDGAGTGCGSVGGSGGMASTTIGAYAGGGGNCGCRTGDGGNGSLSGGNHGNDLRGGKGGSGACGINYGGGGGGGGFQYGNTDYTSRLSYGGGGGGGGGSQYGYSGGLGGQGGGLVLILLDKLTLDGKIEAKGELGQCQPVKNNHKGGTGGSGAGGSVVIVTKQLVGTVSGKIDVQGGATRSTSECGIGVGSGGSGGIGRWVVQTTSTVFKSG